MQTSEWTKQNDVIMLYYKRKSSFNTIYCKLTFRLDVKRVHEIESLVNTQLQRPIQTYDSVFMQSLDHSYRLGSNKSNKRVPPEWSLPNFHLHLNL